MREIHLDHVDHWALSKLAAAPAARRLHPCRRAPTLSTISPCVSAAGRVWSPVGRIAARQITTIEGLEKDGRLHPVQEAFLNADAMQCAYCTSGMIMASVGLLSRTPRPSRDEIVKGMNGNICRCGTYQRIIAAIESVGK